MRKFAMLGAKGFYVLLVLLTAEAGIGTSYAAYEPYSSSQANSDNELHIGVPQYPRRLNRELPEVAKEHGVDVGILKLHPSFVTRVEFDDNITLRKNDKEEDVIFTQQPGLVGEMKLGNHRIEGGYGMEILNYVKNEEENAINHLAHGLVELNFNDLQFLIEDNFEKSTNRLFSETSARDELIINSIDVRALYDRPHWAAETGWRHNTIDHQTPEFQPQDYNEDIAAFLAGYKVMPKTLALVETDFGWVYYDDNQRNADQQYWQILTGVRGEPTEKISMTAKVGYQGRRLDDTTFAPSPTDFHDFVAESDVVFRMTEHDILRAGYDRTPRISTFASNGWYRQDQISGSYRKQFAEKWYITPFAAWQINRYPESATLAGDTHNRSDNFVQTGLTLEYQIQDWLWARLKYNFRTRNSNFDALDYNNNRVIADVTFNY